MPAQWFYGEPVTPTLAVTDALGNTMTEGVDYQVRYADNDKVGTAITFWLMGSFHDVDQADLAICVIPMLVGFVLLLSQSWKLNVLSFGNEEARATGVNTRSTRLLTIFAATIITSVSVSVADVVMMGRTPYVNRLCRTSEHDRVVALHALDLLGIRGITDQPYTKLSGGQQQMTLIARALTQQSDILVMDEPTASLDFGNQQLVLSRMRLLSQMGKVVVMVTHDPDHALYCADRVVVMERGRAIKTGTPAERVTSEILRRIYNVDARVLDVEPGLTEKACIPVGRRR